MNLERITQLILDLSPKTNPDHILKQFEITKKDLCPKCVFNINLPEDHLCGDCEHAPVRDMQDDYLRAKLSSKEERINRAKELNLNMEENSICIICSKEYHRKDIYVVNERDVCVDCFSRLLKNSAVWCNETGIIQTLRFLEAKTLRTERFVNKEDYNEENHEIIKEEMLDELWENVKKHSTTGFYGNIQRAHLEEYDKIHLVCEYVFLSPHDKNRLVKTFYERDVNTNKVLLEEILSGSFREVDA